MNLGQLPTALLLAGQMRAGYLPVGNLLVGQMPEGHLPRSFKNGHLLAEYLCTISQS